ncbi:MAG: hypothetical protein ABSG14_01400 [Verrucomicrobiia bacterium]|jgi:hypothetical protein
MEPEVKYVVQLTTPGYPVPLLLDTVCSSLDTKQKISEKVWGMSVAEAAHFPKEVAEKLAAEANANGAKESLFKAIPAK